MTKRITIIDGHPDPDPARYVHALAEAYAAGAAIAIAAYGSTKA